MPKILNRVGKTKNNNKVKNLEMIQFHLIAFIIENISQEMLNKFYLDNDDPLSSYSAREKVRYIDAQVGAISGHSLTDGAKKLIQEWKENLEKK